MTVHPAKVPDEGSIKRGAVWVVALVLLGIAGGFKDTALLAWVPVDVTLLTALAVAAGVLTQTYRNHGFLPPGLGVVLVLWLCFLPGFLIAYVRNLDLTKGLVLFSLTLLTAIAPLYILTARRHLRLWVISQLVIAAVALLAISLFPSQYDLVRGQLGIEGASTISVGRLVGAGALISLILVLDRARKGPLLAILALILVGTMLGVGNRASIVAFAVAVIVVTLFSKRFSRYRYRAILFLVAATGILALLIRIGHVDPAGRITTLLNPWEASAADRAIAVREALVAVALRMALDNPWGEGWSGFAVGHESYAVHFSSYPHSVFPEVLAEGGWLAGLAFLVFSASALLRLFAISDTHLGLMLFALAAFWLTAACFSEDVNGNRMMWMALSVAFVSIPRFRESAAPQDVGRRGSGRLLDKAPPNSRSGRLPRAENGE